MKSSCTTQFLSRISIPKNLLSDRNSKIEQKLWSMVFMKIRNYMKYKPSTKMWGLYFQNCGEHVSSATTTIQWSQMNQIYLVYGKGQTYSKLQVKHADNCSSYLKIIYLRYIKKFSVGLLIAHLVNMTKEFCTPPPATVMDTLQDKTAFNLYHLQTQP